MRKRFSIKLAASGRWPDNLTGGINRPFNWVKVDNRGANGVDVGLNANPTAGDLIDTLMTVSNGKVRVFNVGGPFNGGKDTSDAWPDQLYLVSASGTTVILEVADHPIVDVPGTT